MKNVLNSLFGRRPRVALCISGQMRTFQRCFPSLDRYLLQPLSPDVFVHTWSETGASHKENAESLTEVVDEGILNKYYSPKLSVIEQFDSSFFYSLGGIDVPAALQKAEPVHYKGSLPCFYKIYACNELRRQYQSVHGNTYDVVIKLRPDLELSKVLPLRFLWDSANNDVLYSESDLLNPGYQLSDKLAFSSPATMDVYSGVWSSLAKYWQSPLGDNPPDTHRVGERLMRHHVISNKLVSRPCRVGVSIMRLQGR